MPLQYARPISDISTGTWSPTPLHASLDEVVATTTDTIRSAAGVVTDVAEVALSAVTDPNVATGYKFRIMYRKDAPGGTSQVNLIVSVRQGPSVEIQSWTLNDISYDWTITEFELGITETDSISAHGSLRVRLTKVQV
jgi:hypothetical protein